MTLGIDPKNPRDYVGLSINAVPVVQAKRLPTTTDRKYPMWTEWRINKDPISGTEGDFYKLIRFESNGDATWVKISSGTTGPTVTLSDTAGTVVSPTALGNIQLRGSSGISITSDAANNRLDFAVSGDTAIDTVDGDTGSATPDVNGVLTIAGTAAQGISTSGAVNTLTLTIADATTSQKGVLETSTDAESIAGASTSVAVTPASLLAKLGLLTNNTVLLGAGSTAAIATSNTGTTGEVLVGGSPPAFGNTIFGDINIESQTPNDTRAFNVLNRDNTVADNRAYVRITTQPNSTGDPYLIWTIGDADPYTAGYALGIDNSDSDEMKWTYGTSGNTPSTADPLMVLNGSGNFRYPKQPAFLVTASAQNNVTGDGTVYTVQWATEVYDIGSVFASNQLTAPTSGKWVLGFYLTVQTDAASGGTEMNTNIITSNRTYTLDNLPTRRKLANFAGGNNWNRLMGSIVADMDAADTAYITFTSSNGTLVDDIVDGAFWGYQIG